MKTILNISLALIANAIFSASSSAQLSDALMLTVSSGNYSDQTAIRFLDDATDYFDSQLDAYKLRNRRNTPNFCSFVNDQTYSINALNGGGLLVNATVPLNLEVAFSGIYNINGEEIGLFDEVCKITLVDKVTGVRQNLKENPNYTFNFNVGDPIDRFEVVFNCKLESIPTAIQPTSQVVASEVKIFNSEGKILVDLGKAQSNATVNVFDLSGNTIVNTTIDSNSTNWEFTPRQSELYIVSLIVNGKLHTEKVYVQ